MGFKNFLEDLCLKERLVEIVNFESTNQSSFSKWSVSNDSERPLSVRGYADFTMHTGFEKSPRWECKFEVPQNVKYIIINNRKKQPFDLINKSMSVSLEDYFGGHRLIYSGGCRFGSLPESLPLVLRLDDIIKTRKVVVQLDSPGYLHLGAVYFLASQENESKVDVGFYSIRRDGFGERIKSLVNAMVLANSTAGRFCFTWEEMPGESQQFHSIRDRKDIFSESFIEHYCKDGKQVDSLSLLPLKDIPLKSINSESLAAIKYQLTKENADGVLVNQQFLYNQTRVKSIDPRLFKECFECIEWNPALEKAKLLARSIYLGVEPIALHLRAGDIVYGFYRFMDRYFNKVVPVQNAIGLLEKAKGEGRGVIIFGQDDVLCRKLAQQYGGIYSEEYSSKLESDEQKALFDVVLMSRCSKIYAGSSGFAVLSSWIAGQKLQNGDISTESKPAFEAVVKSIFDFSHSNTISDLQISFSIFYQLLSSWDYLDLQTKLIYVDQCRQLDSENAFYDLVSASLCYDSGDCSKGDEVSRSLINRKSRHGLKWLAKTIRPDGTTTLGKWISSFIEKQSVSSFAKIVVFYDDFFCKKKDVRGLVKSELTNEGWFCDSATRDKLNSDFGIKV